VANGDHAQGVETSRAAVQIMIKAMNALLGLQYWKKTTWKNFTRQKTKVNSPAPMSSLREATSYPMLGIAKFCMGLLRMSEVFPTTNSYEIQTLCGAEFKGYLPPRPRQYK
jgi:hypothetical protein